MEILELCEGDAAKELGRVREKYGSVLEFVEMDQPVYPTGIPNDAELHRLWGLEHVRSLDAWSRLNHLGLESQETVVAVIDTGIQLDHPDLKDSLWRNQGEIPGNGIDDDGNGFIDDVHGYDFAGDNGNPEDDNGHGTHCAGIIAATANNSVGISGIASRSAKVRLMALRFIDASGSGGTVSGAVSALEYALSFGVPVSSSSWGGPDTSDALKVAIQRATEAGHLFIAAAGNSGRSIADGTYYPCVYRQAGVLCVAATDRSDNLASFSNYATKYVQIAAPGVDIYSTWTGSGYLSSFGTSMSTPYVSGAAALVVSEFGYSGTLVRQLLLDSAVAHNKLTGKVDGGRLDVMNLIRMAESANDFWFVAEGDRTASMQVTIPANTSTSVTLQLGSDHASTGIIQTEVNITWPGGQKTIPVSYTVQGRPKLELLQSHLEWPQVPASASSPRSFHFTNMGNGSARIRLDSFSYPFGGQSEEIAIPPGRSTSVEIYCAPSTTGEWFGHGLFKTNSGLDAWESLQPEGVESGTVFNVSLKCVSMKDPYLELERFSGAAEELSNGGLRFLEPVVHAEWEPFLRFQEAEGDLVLPAASNSAGCSPYDADVSGCIVLVSRGQCFFEEKARMAQEANASGVLLYDNQAQTTMPIVAMPRDRAIPKIPMFMVSQAEGESLRDRLQGESIRIKFQWQVVRAYTLPARSTRVSLNISNLGDAPLTWTAMPSLSFGSHSFYESLFQRSELSESMPQFSWTSSGKELSYFAEQHANNESLLQPLPFNFSFYGQMFEEVWINSNGFLAFDGNSSTLELPFRAKDTKPNGIVAGFGWDLVCGICKISSSLITDDGRSCFVIQYANMSFYEKSAPHGAGSLQISFEIRLCDDGCIKFMYAQFPEPDTLYSDAFIGLETIDGDASLSLRSQMPFSNQKPFAVTLQPWLCAASPTSGVLLKNEVVKLVYDVRSNIGHSGLVQVKARDDSGLWRSQKDVRLVQEPFLFAVDGGDWGPCLVEDCSNLSAGVRRRHLQCSGMDGQAYDWDTFCNNSLASCLDLIPEWRDKDGSRCQEYEAKNWCDADGSYGSGWKSPWGAFSDYSFGGYDVTTVCCACGGGVRIPPPATAAACDQNLAAMDMDCDGTIDCADACPLDPQPQCATTATTSSSPEGNTSIGEEVNGSETNLTANASDRPTTSRMPSSTVTSADFEVSPIPCWAWANLTGSASLQTTLTTSCQGCLVMLSGTIWDAFENFSDESTVVDSTGASRGVAWGCVLLSLTITWFGK